MSRLSSDFFYPILPKNTGHTGSWMIKSWLMQLHALLLNACSLAAKRYISLAPHTRTIKISALSGHCFTLYSVLVGNIKKRLLEFASPACRATLTKKLALFSLTCLSLYQKWTLGTPPSSRRRVTCVLRHQITRLSSRNAGHSSRFHASRGIFFHRYPYSNKARLLDTIG